MRRKEQVTIATMRIGHTLLNSTLFIIGKHQDGMRDECQQPETVPHVLIHRRYSRERKELLETLRELGLEEISVKGILNLGSSGRVKGVVFFIVFHATSPGAGLYVLRHSLWVQCM
jgi:hypothetical protein